MTCHKIHMTNGAFAVACSRGEHRKRCRECGRGADRLCDFALTGSAAGRTCDAPLCRSCAANVGPDIHYCGAHARKLERARAKLTPAARAALDGRRISIATALDLARESAATQDSAVAQIVEAGGAP